MKLNAYLLAADPAWIEASVLSYYDRVDRLVVSYDKNGRGWTGAPIAVEECLGRLRAIDRLGKMRFIPGEFWRAGHTPMENDTYQRQCALDAASEGAEWVLSFDTDEVLPELAALDRILIRAGEWDLPAVEWPMRVLFQRMRDGRFLEVCAEDGGDRFDYPGPIATRPGQTVTDARRTTGRYLRPIVRGDDRSLQICRPAEVGREVRETLLEAHEAILHNSWARSPASIRSKIRSWGHASGWRSWRYYALKWSLAPMRWKHMRNFHPFAGGLWPALKPCAAAMPQASVEYGLSVD
ncbi:MAG TPA: hypothetical protein VFC46_04680 [Humisphaera sp.]|nr:hypothetical protein [Humisphaera sp.]